MMADRAGRNQKRVLNTFNPCEINTAQIAEWLKLGDIQEAEQQAQLLALFLSQMAQKKEAQQAIMRLGIGWIGADVAKFIAEKLLANSCDKKGKQHKSGAKLFAKVLVPTKTAKSQFHARYLATLVYQLGGDSDENLEYLTEVINKEIATNNEVLKSFKDGSCDNLAGFNPALPIYTVTKRAAQTGYRRYIDEIKAAEAD